MLGSGCTERTENNGKAGCFFASTQRIAVAIDEMAAQDLFISFLFGRRQVEGAQKRSAESTEKN